MTMLTLERLKYDKSPIRDEVSYRMKCVFPRVLHNGDIEWCTSAVTMRYCANKQRIIDRARLFYKLCPDCKYWPELIRRLNKELETAHFELKVYPGDIIEDSIGMRYFVLYRDYKSYFIVCDKLDSIYTSDIHTVNVDKCTIISPTAITYEFRCYLLALHKNGPYSKKLREQLNHIPIKPSIL